MRRAAVPLVLAVLAAPVAATPLCRDAKGLFTPCPRTANSHARAILRTVAPKEVAPAPAPSAEPHTPPELAAPATPKPAAPPRPKFCHDIRGLFTPCPR